MPQDRTERKKRTSGKTRLFSHKMQKIAPTVTGRGASSSNGRKNKLLLQTVANRIDGDRAV